MKRRSRLPVRLRRGPLALLPAAVAGAAVLAALLGGCVNLPYYAQAVRGHLDLMSRRVQIEQVLARDDLDPDLRETLTLVLEVRDFASESLGLPDNDSYRSYAELDRPYVVWNVVAAPSDSLQPRRWCFLFVGCLSYKGYFDESRARRQADRLAGKGWEVAVGGVAAYSTLGRFADPFLDTMVGYSDARTASVIFHELAHQALYVKGDTAFNEGFASFVAEEGVRRWFSRRDGADADREAFARWQAREARRRAFTRLVLDARQRLATLYADETLTDAAREAAKAAAYARLRADYRRLRDTRWDGYAGYDRWIENVNNARLASVATYRQHLPAFRALLAQEQGDFAAFLRRAEALAALPAEARRERLAALAAVSAARVGGLAPVGVEG